MRLNGGRIGSTKSKAHERIQGGGCILQTTRTEHKTKTEVKCVSW